MLIKHPRCVSKNDTDITHYNFDADQPILTFLAGNRLIAMEFELLWAYLISHTGLLLQICCEITILYKPIANEKG